MRKAYEDDFAKIPPLLEKMRRASEAAAARKALEDETGIHDADMLQQLEALGLNVPSVLQQLGVSPAAQPPTPPPPAATTNIAPAGKRSTS